MDEETVTRVAIEALAGTIAFPEVVRQLVEAGVEYYQVDYVGRRKRFHDGGGEMVETTIEYGDLPPVGRF